jgi:bacillithiol system protein YtxJ
MNNIDWLLIEKMTTLEEVIELSHSTPCLIYKHSTRCSISSLAQNRLEKSWAFSSEELLPYFLDLITYRAISNAIAEQFGVPHESPQVLLIKDGRCVYDASHLQISAREIKEQLTEVKGKL